MKLVSTLLVLSALTGSIAFAARGTTRTTEGPQLAELAWLTGHWASEEQGTRTEEAWLAPAGGIMLAVNRTVPASGGAEFEFLRIEQRKDQLVYIASPGGRGATEFPLADLGAGFVLFENPAHDFPRTIRYELTKDGALHARVAGDAGGQEMALEWTWKKQ